MTDTLFPDDEDPLSRARRARDAGMEQARMNLEEWSAYAADWILNYLVHNDTMFTDDLWRLGLEQPPVGEDGKPRMRALGPIVSSFARKGYIRKSGLTRQRTLGHAAEGPVWRSMLYQKPRLGVVAQ